MRGSNNLSDSLCSLSGGLTKRSHESKNDPKIPWHFFHITVSNEIGRGGSWMDDKKRGMVLREVSSKSVGEKCEEEFWFIIHSISRVMMLIHEIMPVDFSISLADRTDHIYLSLCSGKQWKKSFCHEKWCYHIYCKGHFDSLLCLSSCFRVDSRIMNKYIDLIIRSFDLARGTNNIRLEREITRKNSHIFISGFTSHSLLIFLSIMPHNSDHPISFSSKYLEKSLSNTRTHSCNHNSFHRRKVILDSQVLPQHEGEGYRYFLRDPR